MIEKSCIVFSIGFPEFLNKCIEICIVSEIQKRFINFNISVFANPKKNETVDVALNNVI